MLRTQRPHFASQPILRKTDATDGRSGRAVTVSRTSRSERTLQEQTIMASPSLERLQTTFYISSLHPSLSFATGPLSLFRHRPGRRAKRRKRRADDSEFGNLPHRAMGRRRKVGGAKALQIRPWSPKSGNRAGGRARRVQRRHNVAPPNFSGGRRQSSDSRVFPGPCGSTSAPKSCGSLRARRSAASRKTVKASISSSCVR
jgi:hypothetical protein